LLERPPCPKNPIPSPILLLPRFVIPTTSIERSRVALRSGLFRGRSTFVPTALRLARPKNLTPGRLVKAQAATLQLIRRFKIPPALRFLGGASLSHCFEAVPAVRLQKSAAGD
jgi:hypothetical protein